MALYRNITANYVGRVWAMASIYLFVPIYIAVLGAESYALIAFYTVLLTFASLADVGLSATFSREAARVRDPRNLLDMLSTMERLIILAALVVAGIVVILAPLVADRWLNDVRQIDRDAVEVCLRLMALTIPAQMAMSFYSAGLLGLQRQVKGNAIQSLFILVRSGLVVPVLWQEPDPVIFFVWQLAVTLLFALVARAALLSTMGCPCFAMGRYDWAKIRPLLRFASGMILISVIASINTQIDKLFVSSWFSVSDFGYYAAASMLAQLPVALTLPIVVAFYPRLTELLAQQKIDAACDLYNRFSALVALVAGLLCGGLAFFSTEILTLWLLKANWPGELPFVVTLLSIGTFFYSIQQTPYYLSIARGENHIIIILALTSLFITSPLSYLFIKKYGILGTAIPWIIVNILNYITISFIVNKKTLSESNIKWNLYYIFTPSLFGFLTMAISSLFANLLYLSPILSCIVSGFFASLALCAFLRYMFALKLAIPIVSRRWLP